MRRALVTGAMGFVGRAIVKELTTREEWVVSVLVRRTDVKPGERSGRVFIGDLAAGNDWSQALADVDVVIHAAARVHVMKEIALDPLVEFRQVNVQGTLSLARQAAAMGIRRFIFISSIKVNGEETMPGRPFTAEDLPSPKDAYGVSKLEAEQGLMQIAAETRMEVVIIRPPLIYGSGAKANFGALMHAVKRGIPLPIKSIRNLRSLLALDNLVDLVIRCMDHPGAVNEVFLVSDGEDVSTPELVVRLASAMGRPAQLLPVPIPILRLGAAVLGKTDIFQRLSGSLQLDIEKTRRQLEWSPPFSLDNGLKKAVHGVF